MVYIIGERTVQQQIQGEYQILDTEPFLNQNSGQTRHARGPVYESSVSYILLLRWLFQAILMNNGCSELVLFGRT